MADDNLTANVVVAAQAAAPTTYVDRGLEWARVILSMLVAGCLIGVYIAAWLDKDQQTKTLISGAAVSCFTTVVGFWFGSSKDRQPPPSPPPSP